MNESRTMSALLPETLAQLRTVDIFNPLSDAAIGCLQGAIAVQLEPGDTLIEQGAERRIFSILLVGSLRVIQLGHDGYEQTVHIIEAGTSFGETTLLAGLAAGVSFRAAERCELLELSESLFWHLMSECPGVRQSILGNMTKRLAKMQSAVFQQEKMASLGTLAAGLMHELNNPGAAARRASAQLRVNMMRLQELCARFTRITLTEEQKECLLELQAYALCTKPRISLSAIEQTDAEEALAHWMESAQITDSWRLAPTLVSIGITAQSLQCARSSFTGDVFSDALAWLEALVSSMQLVGTVEESITRVTELVAAVKSYAYEGRGQAQSVDINKSIRATLVILGHKLREKQIKIQEQFASNLPPLTGVARGLNQVWTNLLDNAIDAAPQNGCVSIRTWAEKHQSADKSQTDLCILVDDNGAGIPTECQAQIFDPFFTTKPVGVGTGLGLGIVYRIVEQCGGTIHFSSLPGHTEFVVRLPTT